MLNKNGSVLIVAVWTLAALSIMAVGLGVRGSFALGVVNRWKEQFRAAQAAESAAQYALGQMALDPTPAVDGPREEWMRLLDLASLDQGGLLVQVGDGLVDEDRKLNLNTASEQMLYTLLIQLGTRAAQAEEVSQSILDWRDEDSDEHDHGAERYHYSNLSPNYDCKDGPFENVEELLLVKGVTPDLYRAMVPYVTVFGYGPLNLNTADLFLLQTLGFSEAGAGGLVAYRAGEDDLAGTEDDRMVTPDLAGLSDLSAYLSPEDQNRLAKCLRDGLVGGQSGDFAMTISSETPTLRSSIKVWCVLGRGGQIKAWREE